MKVARGCWGRVLMLFACGSLMGPSSRAADPAKAEPAKDAAQVVHKVRPERLKVEVTVKGVVESHEMSEVAISLEEPGTSLVVKKAIGHGAAVKKGDTLLWLDLEKIDRTIRDLEADGRLAELAIRLAEEELPILEKNTPLDLAAAEQAKKRSDEDLKRWIDTDRAFTEKRAERNLKQARESLEYQKEELRQLEKMYKANDLTEDTEEIILKRQRNQVAAAEFYLQISELAREQALKVDIPRRDEDTREAAVKQALALDKAKATLPLTLSQKRLALEKMKYDRTKADERLANLKKDREAMTIKAPADGIAYYGKFTRGDWSGSAAAAAKLRRGGSIQSEEVVMTIVDPRRLFVRATVDEPDLERLQGELSGKITVAARPSFKQVVKIANISEVPIAPGSYEIGITLQALPHDDPLLPSMACTTKFVVYLNEKALTVPVASVFDDELSDDAQCVYVLGKDRKPEKRNVTVGKKTDKKAEILTGLREGDEVLLQKPTDISLAAAKPVESAPAPAPASAPAAGKDATR